MGLVSISAFAGLRGRRARQITSVTTLDACDCASFHLDTLSNSICKSKVAFGGISCSPLLPYPWSAGTLMVRCIITTLSSAYRGSIRRLLHQPGVKESGRTFPPTFMPSTALLRAGGGLGPLAPANRPLAESFIFLTPTSATAEPAVNSNGCNKPQSGGG